MKPVLKPKEAVIYCRSALADDNRLDAQEARCRDYARDAGLEVVSVFRDAASGMKAERPGIAALVRWLKTRDSDCIVLVEDIGRVARDVVLHRRLNEAIREAGGIIASTAKATEQHGFVRNEAASHERPLLPRRER